MTSASFPGSWPPAVPLCPWELAWECQRDTIEQLCRRHIMVLFRRYSEAGKRPSAGGGTALPTRWIDLHFDDVVVVGGGRSLVIIKILFRK